MQIASAVGTCHQLSSTLAPWGGNSQDYKEGPSRLLAPPSWCPLGSSSILEQELVILMVHKVPPVCPLRPTLCPPGCLLHPPAFSPNLDPSPAPSSVCLHLDASYSITLGGRLKMQDTTRNVDRPPACYSTMCWSDGVCAAEVDWDPAWPLAPPGSCQDWKTFGHSGCFCGPALPWSHSDVMLLTAWPQRYLISHRNVELIKEFE